MSDFYTLGIETSCDDTSLCLIKNQNEILSFLSYSQIEELKEWQGVVPEVVARNHQAKLLPLFKAVIQESNILPSDINLIGVTTNPGLMGALLMGTTFAKSLSLINQTPLIGIHHLEAHLEAIHLDQDPGHPYLGLLVSGGHSSLYLVSSPTQFQILGSTLDDAAGEAFDKGAKSLGLGYPGGHLIDKLAKEGDPKVKKYPFTISFKKERELIMSFSGLKTALLNTINNTQAKGEELHLNQLCYEYQKAIIDTLLMTTKKAYQYLGKEIPLVIGGGVACNSYLRQVMQAEFNQVFIVTPKFCTDNGAMIAHRAYQLREKALSYPHSLELTASPSPSRPKRSELASLSEHHLEKGK